MVNDKTLRSGDRVVTAFKPKKVMKLWRHSNAWTLDGTILVAFQQIGRLKDKTKQRPNSGQTEHVLDAEAIVSWACTHHIA